MVCGGGGGRGELVGVAASSSDTWSSDSGRAGFLKNVVDLDKLLVLPERNEAEGDVVDFCKLAGI